MSYNSSSRANDNLKEKVRKYHHEFSLHQKCFKNFFCINVKIPLDRARRRCNRRCFQLNLQLYKSENASSVEWRSNPQRYTINRVSYRLLESWEFHIGNHWGQNFHCFWSNMSCNLVVSFGITLYSLQIISQYNRTHAYNSSWFSALWHKHL